MKPEKPPSSGSRDEQIPKRLAPLFEEDQNVEGIGSLTLADQTEVLEAFREQWKQELTKNKNDAGNEEKREEEARALFLQGVECEKRGEMSEAVHKYTRAMKLVPDIERKVDPHVAAPRARSTSRARGTSKAKAPESNNNLVRRFQNKISERGARFLSAGDASSCLLNRLPLEILDLILRYSLGNELNVRLLETLSEVSAGMYLMARGNELWRQIHFRSLGPNQEHYQDSTINWRELYLTHPHLRFDGVYLSKITYIRHGETGFQDNNYRPWHTVVYFRLLRFFADGAALMTTSSDSPQTSVNMLKSRTPGRGETVICTGTWYQEEEKIILQVRREYPPPLEAKPSRRNRRAPNHVVQEYGILKHAFRIVFRLVPLKIQGRWGLQWLENRCTVTYLDGRMSSSDLEAEKNSQDFPPLRFVRVKSYVE